MTVHAYQKRQAMTVLTTARITAGTVTNPRTTYGHVTEPQRAAITHINTQMFGDHGTLTFYLRNNLLYCHHLHH